MEVLVLSVASVAEKRGTGTIPGRRLGIDGLLGDGEGMVNT